jgi:ribonuclease P protein component
VQTFSKTERLSSKIIIDELFEKGKSFNCFPFKIIWTELPKESKNSQVLFSVPKRLFKRAVDRNRLKRLMREAYRKNKDGLYKSLGEKKIGFIFIYLDKTILEYKEVEEKIIAGLIRLNKEVC